MRQPQATNTWHRAHLSQEEDCAAGKGSWAKFNSSNRLLVEPRLSSQTGCSWRQRRPRTATCDQEAYLHRVGKLQKLPIVEVQAIAGQGTAKLPEDARCLLTIHNPAAERWHWRDSSQLLELCVQVLLKCCPHTHSLQTRCGVKAWAPAPPPGRCLPLPAGLHRQPDSVRLSLGQCQPGIMAVC